jgi:hypothetical protein
MGNTEALVVRNAGGERAWQDADVAHTMLDMIAWLERAESAPVRVILAGEFARDRELASVLREMYPRADVVATVV